MAYSKTCLKGCIGYEVKFTRLGRMAGWPLIVMERAKSDKPETPVLCEVFGLSHECGSVYRGHIILAADYEEWTRAVIEQGFTPVKRYFEGELLCQKE